MQTQPLGLSPCKMLEIPISRTKQLRWLKMLIAFWFKIKEGEINPHLKWYSYVAPPPITDLATNTKAPIPKKRGTRSTTVFVVPDMVTLSITYPCIYSFG